MSLSRMLRELMPSDTEVRGLYALLLVTDARRSLVADRAAASAARPDTG